MKTAEILRTLINILYIVLLTILTIGALFFISVFFFNEYLPLGLQGFKNVFNLLFTWKLFLIPLSTVLNFILFISSVYYLRKCIKPFIASDFYSNAIILNLKKAGQLFVFIGVSTVFFRLIAMFYFQSIVPIQGQSILIYVGTIVSLIDVETLFLTIIGLFFLLFSNTLEKAKELKQENDLTI